MEDIAIAKLLNTTKKIEVTNERRKWVRDENSKTYIISDDYNKEGIWALLTLEPLSIQEKEDRIIVRLSRCSMKKFIEIYGIIDGILIIKRYNEKHPNKLRMTF